MPDQEGMMYMIFLCSQIYLDRNTFYFAHYGILLTSVVCFTEIM